MSDPLERLKAALAGRYEVQGEIGRGGMATVYLAMDPRHNRKVAVKVLNPELAANLGAKRFLKEIEIAAQLTHPRVVPLYDSGEADGLLYYVMPYVEGETVRERLRRERQLPVEDAIEITAQVASALDFAHEQGIVHRDIKPENVYLQSGEALVADFGLGKALSEAGGQRLTQTGIAVGTPLYMSPEQAAGDQHVDPRSDVYALGCMTFEMLAGEPPFTGATPQAILARKSVESMPSIRVVRETVPAGVERALQKALAKVPADRWATAGAYAEALETGLAEQDFTPSGEISAQPAGRKGRLWQVIVGVLMAGALGIAGYAMLGSSDVEPEAAAAPTEADLYRADELYRIGAAKFTAGADLPADSNQLALFLEARSELEEATRLDPNHAEAHAQLAMVHVFLGQNGHLPKDSTFVHVREMAERALAIDSTLAIAHEALALAKWIGTGGFNWQAVYDGFMRAAALDSGRANKNLAAAAQVQIDLGRRDLALSALAQAPEPSNPFERDMSRVVAVQSHLFTGDPAGGLREASAWAAEVPESTMPHYYKFHSFLELDRFDEAGSALRDWSSLRPDRPETPLLMTVIYHARRGDRDAAIRTLEQFHRDYPDASGFRSSLAMAYAWLGDLDTAFVLLDEEFDTQGFAFRFPSDPLYAPLRGDVRFNVLLGTMGLECTYHEDGTHQCREA